MRPRYPRGGRGDRLVENSETFFLRLTEPTNAFIADGLGVATIIDNEPRISINNVSKNEGDGKTTTSFSFTVRLSAAYDQAVTVNYATASGTATAGSDYTSTAGSVTFAAGETSKRITVYVKGDKTKELNETFFVDLFGPSSNALISLGAPQARQPRRRPRRKFAVGDVKTWHPWHARSRSLLGWTA